MDPELIQAMRELREAGLVPLPPTAFGMPDLDVLRGRGALGPGTLPQPNPLANYPQARQPGEGWGPYKVDGLAGEKTDAANARYQSDLRAAKQQEIDQLAAQGKIEEGRRLKEAADRKAAEDA